MGDYRSLKHGYAEAECDDYIAECDARHACVLVHHRDLTGHF